MCVEYSYSQSISSIDCTISCIRPSSVEGGREGREEGEDGRKREGGREKGRQGGTYQGLICTSYIAT